MLVCVAGIAMVAISMCFVSAFADFVLIAFFFALPAISFDKWFWPALYTTKERGNLVYGGMLGLGLLDFVLIALYMSWFYRVFIARIQPLPRLYFLDLIAASFLLAHLLGIIGAADTYLGVGASEYLFKYLLLYFYISRNLRSEHLPWLVVALCVTIVAEAGFGGYQHYTGKLLGFALDKGAGSASSLSFQYSVPGLSHTNRATGTAYDSHAFGNFIGMILPFPLVLFMTPWVNTFLRWVLAGVTSLAVLALVLSFSRSAWLSSAIGLVIGFILMVAVWREGTPVVVAAIVGFFTIGSSPWTVNYIYDRFKNSPIGTITTRLEQYQVSLTIWQRFPIFGVGPNNYLRALKKYDYLWLKELPVHDVILQILAENGLLGLLCYLGIVFSAMRRLFRIARMRTDLAGRLAMAALIGLISTFFDGATDPLFREPTVFATFWILVAMSVALANFEPQNIAVAAARDDGRQAA
jgi:hypothetical protein